MWELQFALGSMASKISFETKFEYIHPVWNMYLGGFDPETFSSRGSSCPTLNQLG